jgi:uncharacterized membrane protein YwzB
MDKPEAIERTVRHILAILKVWITYWGLQSKFTRFFAEKPHE